MSISRDGNSLFDRARHVGTLATGVNNSMTIKFIHGLRLEKQRLLDIASYIEPMTHPRIVRDQPDAPPTGTEDANRPRIVSQTGGHDLFRSVRGLIVDSDPIGSIEDGPAFAPAPGVYFSHHELFRIAQLLRQAEAVRS
jgi:hypothetical protein